MWRFLVLNRLQRYYKNLKYTNYSVKKLQTYGFLLLTLLISGSVSAKTEVDSYIGAYAQFGEWSLLPSNSQYASSLGVGGGVGAQFEIQIGPAYSPTRFLLDVGTGAVGGWTAFSHIPNAVATLANQTDLDGERFDYVYEIYDRSDNYSNIALHVPLMVGVQHKHFYLLAGAKVGFNLWTQTHATAYATTYGNYATIGSTKGVPMPEYQFFDRKKMSTTQSSKLNMDIDVCFEIGARLGYLTNDIGYDVPQQKTEFRLAAFVDYGLFDIHVAGTNSLIIMPGKYDTDPRSANYVYRGTSMIDQTQLNDIMRTDNFAKSVNNLLIGIKFTVLFQLPKARECVTCSYRSTIRSHGGSRRGVKYEE